MEGLRDIRDRVRISFGGQSNRARQRLVLKATDGDREGVQPDAWRRIVAEVGEGANSLWVLHCIGERPILSDFAVAMKSLIVIHRVLQEGPPQIAQEWGSPNSMLEGLGGHWGTAAKAIPSGSQVQHCMLAVSEYSRVLALKVELMIERDTGVGRLDGRNVPQRAPTEPSDSLQALVMLLSYADRLTPLALHLVAPCKDCRRLGRFQFMRVYIGAILALLDENWLLLCAVSLYVKDLLCRLHAAAGLVEERPTWLQLASHLLAAQPRFARFHAALCDFVAHCHQLRCAGYVELALRIPQVPQALLDLFADLNQLVRSQADAAGQEKEEQAGARNISISNLSTAAVSTQIPTTAGHASKSDLASTWNPSAKVLDALRTVDSLQRSPLLAACRSTGGSGMVGSGDIAAGSAAAARGIEAQIAGKPRDDAAAARGYQLLDSDSDRGEQAAPCFGGASTSGPPSTPFCPWQPLPRGRSCSLRIPGGGAVKSPRELHGRHQRGERSLSPAVAWPLESARRLESQNQAQSHAEQPKLLPAAPSQPLFQAPFPLLQQQRTWPVYQVVQLVPEAKPPTRRKSKPPVGSLEPDHPGDSAAGEAQVALLGPAAPQMSSSVCPLGWSCIGRWQERRPPSWAAAICQSNQHKGSIGSQPLFSTPLWKAAPDPGTPQTPPGAHEKYPGSPTVKDASHLTPVSLNPFDMSPPAGAQAVTPPPARRPARAQALAPAAASDGASSPSHQRGSEEQLPLPSAAVAQQILERPALAPARAEVGQRQPTEGQTRGRSGGRASSGEDGREEGVEVPPTMACLGRDRGHSPRALTPVLARFPSGIRGPGATPHRAPTPPGRTPAREPSIGAPPAAAPVIAEWEVEPSELRFEEMLGTGSTAEVFRASWHGTDVAVKRLRGSGQLPMEFVREISVLLRLRHPNLVLFMGAATQAPPPLIISEFCAGGTVFALLHQRRDLALPWGHRASMAIDVAKGMNFLHRRQVVHRDLKSLNLLLAGQVASQGDMPPVKVSDFGLSRAWPSEQQRAFMTSGCGTYHWMAPEVLDGHRYNEKVDVYSYGICLFELIARRIPYDGSGLEPVSIAVAVTRGRRPDASFIPKDCPADLRFTMECCWAHSPSSRPGFDTILETLKLVQCPRPV